ncbi:imidazole glycerol phosphate synthase subunit HisH [Tardiphaga sp. 866_E4_N2_1]|uniref:imidazole glycerol phosphate synthase subunit HisH n=1 Tax=unclassified Tardiphaga TaxID=2631404 RepID=UPI003F28B369
MSQSVLVVDYGVGNLLSVCRAFEACGAEVELSGSASRIAAAKRLVVPGVGAFGDCMGELRKRDLVGPVLDYVSSGAPVLGICVGMQMLLEISEEFGEHKGLGILPGRVRAIPQAQPDGPSYKIPHIGWSELNKPSSEVEWSSTILDGVAPGSTCYFVHSFTAVPVDDGYRLADCDYHGQRISAALQIDNVSGTQFHPEKSGETGLRILRNFLTLGADRRDRGA